MSMALVRVLCFNRLYNINCAKIKIIEGLLSVSTVRFLGRELLLAIALHCLLNKSFNKFAFAKKSEASQLPTDSGGIMRLLEAFP